MKHNRITNADSGSVNKGIAKPHVARRFIVSQTTCQFNVDLLEREGWEARTHKNHIYDWVEYEKSWTIQDMDGSAYRVEVSLREYENVALCYVNGQWVGRCLYLSEAEKVVAAIKAGCR